MLPLLSALPTNSTCVSQGDPWITAEVQGEVGGRDLTYSHAATQPGAVTSDHSTKTWAGPQQWLV